MRSVPVIYYRFHGVPERYASGYTTDAMSKITDEIKAFRGVTDVYIYFNNDIHMEAVRNAIELRKIISA